MICQDEDSKWYHEKKVVTYSDDYYYYDYTNDTTGTDSTGTDSTGTNTANTETTFELVEVSSSRYLILQNVTTEDEGCYSCRQSDTDTYWSQGFCLNVSAPSGGKKNVVL